MTGSGGSFFFLSYIDTPAFRAVADNIVQFTTSGAGPVRSASRDGKDGDILAVDVFKMSLRPCP